MSVLAIFSCHSRVSQTVQSATHVLRQSSPVEPSQQRRSIVHHQHCTHSLPADWICSQHPLRRGLQPIPSFNPLAGTSREQKVHLSCSCFTLYITGRLYFSLFPYRFFLRSLFGVFLALLLLVVISSLVVLSLFLTYSLMSLHLHERVKDISILRVLGTTRSAVLATLLWQCLRMTIPAVLLGLGIAWSTWIP